MSFFRRAGARLKTPAKIITVVTTQVAFAYIGGQLVSDAYLTCHNLVKTLDDIQSTLNQQATAHDIANLRRTMLRNLRTYQQFQSEEDDGHLDYDAVVRIIQTS